MHTTRKRIQIHVAESEGRLKYLYQQQTTDRARQRIKALLVYKTQKAFSYSAIAQYLGCNRHSVARWFELYQTQGMEGLLDLRSAHPRTGQLTPEIRQATEARLNDPEQGFDSYKAAWLWLKETFGISLSYDRVHHWLRHQLGATLKVPRPSHVKKNVEAAEAFKKK